MIINQFSYCLNSGDNCEYLVYAKGIAENDSIDRGPVFIGFSSKNNYDLNQDINSLLNNKKLLLSRVEITGPFDDSERSYYERKLKLVKKRNNRISQMVN